MIVFKYFFKVLKEYRTFIILYTVLLMVFGGFSLQTQTGSTEFVAEKPDVLFINKDEDSVMNQNLTAYMKENATLKEIEQNEEAINDAIFYRDISYMVTIPSNYTKEFMEGKNPKIEVKSTGDFEAAYMEMLIERYVKVANVYQQENYTQEEIVKQMDQTLDKKAQIEITSKLDTSSLQKASFFYNFANYSILAGCVYVIAVVMSSFKKKSIKKRTVISSMKNSSYNRSLFLANMVFAVILWAIYVVVSIILVKDAMLSVRGLYYILNSFVFTICALSIAFLIGNLVSNKEAITGIVNVLSLGSSFLCGAFVPSQWLPEAVTAVAHIFPSYWYIQNNDLIGSIEELNLQTLQPFMINLGVVLAFTALFIVITNIITKKKRKEA